MPSSLGTLGTFGLDTLEQIPRTPASDVKKHGWRGVMRKISDNGKVVITNHNDPEAVILSAREYSAIVEALQAANAQAPSSLAALRQRFDQRLAALDADDAGERLRALVGQPAKLGGKVKAGSGY
jgi:prevent-host-death family protein